ncbi:CLUMA_CG011266, isoform A [Clunio marinus]|uniref:CLUMA_CG011266, isoform A n=1 Tax=Clunio marinus TaxID=568069 RepID=A0A1J1ICG7_9DIPT|nr:CLUMA_CG011266, isoform A [Clunio marinus]
MIHSSRWDVKPVVPRKLLRFHKRVKFVCLVLYVFTSLDKHYAMRKRNRFFLLVCEDKFKSNVTQTQLIANAIDADEEGMKELMEIAMDFYDI